MPIKLPKTVNDQSTAIIEASFTDHNGDPVTPNTGTIKWSLFDASGAVVNGREDEPVASDTVVKIALFGDDLVYSEGGALRKFLIECEYDSDEGNNLPLREQAEFWIEDLEG